METTFYAFKSNVRSFLSRLITNPLKANVSDYLKERGFTKQKLINILLKRDVIKRKEKIDDKDKENGNVNYVVKYNVIKKNFDRKLKRIYSKYFEKNEEVELDETVSCGAASGAFVAPISPVRRRKIYVTEKQFEELKESLTLSNVGDYQYDVPFPVKKNDPSLIHNKKGGISMDRIK